eukprot:jgi/Tetstr1/433710/TSEL_022929.t1
MVGTRQFDENAVMQRALDVFRHKGLSATSMIDLALATGVLTRMTTGSPARGCLTTRTAAESNETTPLVRERIRGWLKELEDTIEAGLRQHGLAAQLVLPPRETARFLVTFTRGLAVMERVHQDDASLRELSESLIDVLVQRDAAP